MAAGRFVRRVGMLEQLPRVLADRLEHRLPRLGIAGGKLHEALVHERRQSLDHVVVAADRLGSLERPAAGEDRQSGEELTLLRRQELGAPVERPPERLEPRRLVDRPLRQELEALAQPREQRLERQDVCAGGGELDRERQAVEPPADLGDRGEVRSASVDDRADGLCAVAEKRRRSGVLEGRDTIEMLAVKP